MQTIAYSSFTIFAEWFLANISATRCRSLMGISPLDIESKYDYMLQNCITVCWAVLEQFAENDSAKLVNEL